MAAQKTKTIIKETEEVSERDSPAVLAYRVGQLEIAMKDSALALRESTESHKESAKELATKMDTYAQNFATKTDLEAAQREADKEHERFTQSIETIEHTIENYPLVRRIVFGLVGLILVSVATALIALVVRSQAT